MKEDYSDIIQTPYPFALIRERMKREDRASQFSPFAALTGYEDAIKEEGRITCCKPELTDDEKQLIGKTITDSYEKKREIRITYFVPDEKKKGGSIISCFSVIKKIDRGNMMIFLSDGRAIKIENIVKAES
ncbi:MAG TPA: YolD-like family protein [Candidatus Ornithospirochaeta avicola]|uniref:YolD-like family protein n=1 Tax=Candidatus Ornithospirochaeta avicola TaxID=2840896 RepID=A0A9D1PV83_9SPIO|nr:YolD-like family protein [Candidatus Ornithospirochaeta avicola]